MQEETSSSAFNEASRYDEQAKHERDPIVIAHCYRERDWWLDKAADLEREGR